MGPAMIGPTYLCEGRVSSVCLGTYHQGTEVSGEVERVVCPSLVQKH